MLIKNGYVLDLATSDPLGATRKDVRIDGTRIAQVGAELRPAPGETVLDAAGKLVAPGFVNAHLHSQEALYKGRYANLPLELWMLYAYPILGALQISPELVYLRTMLVGLESIRNGVTTVVDDVIELPFQDRDQLAAVFRAYDDLGIRAHVSGHIMNRPFIDTLPFGRNVVPAELARRVDDIRLITTEEYLDYSREAIDRFHRPQGRLRYVLAPSGPQRCTDDLLSGAADLAREHDAELHIHVVETKMQAVTARLMYGRTMAEHLADVGALDRHTTFAHGVWLTEGDIALLGSAGASVAHNPLANLKLGAGVAPYRQLLDAGVTVGLGSDGLCNGSARLFDVVRLAALLHNVSSPDHGQWPTVAEVLASATAGGARSTLADGVTGTIEAGKAADLVVYDLSGIPFTPLNDLRNHLAFSEDGSSVETVIVDGRTVLDQGKITTVDEAGLLAEFSELAPPVLARHIAVEQDNAQFHAPVTEIHQWASAQPVEVNRYTQSPQAWASYGRESRLFRV
ncbi:amidohydrolase [Mycobacterium tuberculosis]|nr:amidohydrolase [Mycobacterium tuberculosis]